MKTTLQLALDTAETIRRDLDSANNANLQDISPIVAAAPDEDLEKALKDRGDQDLLLNWCNFQLAKLPQKRILLNFSDHMRDSEALCSLLSCVLPLDFSANIFDARMDWNRRARHLVAAVEKSNFQSLKVRSTWFWSFIRDQDRCYCFLVLLIHCVVVKPCFESCKRS